MKRKIFYIMIFCFFLTLLFLSPISGDDWGNFLVGKTGLIHSLGNAFGMYFDWEGRLISRILINILTYYKPLWNIINSLLITMMIYYSIKLIQPKHKKEIGLLTFLMILMMNIYTFSQTVTWIAGNITYLFVIPILFYYFYTLIRKEKEKSPKRTIFFLLINFLCPMFVEHMALVLVFGNGLILISRYLKTKKIDKELLIDTCLAIFSTLLMLLSPGSRARSEMENIEFNQLGLIEKITYNIPNFIYYTFIINSYLLLLLSYKNYLIIKNKVKSIKSKVVLLLFLLPIPLLTVIIYPLSNIYPSKIMELINLNNYFIMVYWILYLFISFFLTIVNEREKESRTGVFLSLIGLAANAVMLLSPTWGYRTSLFTYICLSLTSFISIDQYMKERRSIIKGLTGLTVIIISFYLLLYINVARCQKDLEKSIKLQLKEGKEVIEIERFPSFINCNINPEADYHIRRFKEYYQIPSKKTIQLIQKHWKYFIFYSS